MNYETFNDEVEYVPPVEISEEAINLLNARRGETILQITK